jgi:hypothetical protein
MSPCPNVGTDPRGRGLVVRLVLALLVSCVAWLPAEARAAEGWVSQAGSKADFALDSGAVAATVVFAAEDAKVVDIAAHDLALDVERVTGRRPVVRVGAAGLRGPAVLIGTLGASALIDGLIAAGKLDVGSLPGAWESFVIATVEHPLPGVARALVIVGSDRRGTAFGVYELSQAIGVSPWYWWADVAPRKKAALYIGAGTRRFGPPSVKYRGIFINDEDWGLQKWAALTFEPEHGGIGPKTYGRVFELLLRLKANSLWPGMHPTTPAFNSLAQNAPLADAYAIVMGSSHAEPMLRNNVGEWKAPPADYNYLANRDGVLAYWNERVAANARFDNVYTVGMRGIHDSQMQGPRTDPERVALLEKIFTDQRALLARHTGKPAEQVPQVFAAYKEVLGLYRQGLKVPDDVTLMWPDDNFGYIRNYTSPAERGRAGGFGVYYHLSYLGAPLSYLWLSTTPPALVWEEMTKAYDSGASRIWIANVGDIKPAEIDTEFFLQMAWDVKRWSRDTLPGFLPEWAAREFGTNHAAEIAAIMADYYRLNFARKPEHLQAWLPKEAPRHSAMTEHDAQARLAAFTSLRARVERMKAAIAPEQRDAWFELVAYPVGAAALANQRFIEGEQGHAAAALAADGRLDALLERWNTGLANGKWRHMMTQDLPDGEWTSLRAAKWRLPAYAKPAADIPAHGRLVTIEAGRPTSRRDAGGAGWKVIPGLGISGEGAVAVFPTTMASVAISDALAGAPRIDYSFTSAAGAARLRFHLVPAHPILGSALRFGAGVDGAQPQLVALEFKDGGAEWARGVLAATRTAMASVDVATAGMHTLQVYAIDAGVVIDSIDIEDAVAP